MYAPKLFHRTLNLSVPSVALKVLHVIPTLDPLLGGPSSAIRGMTKCLLAAGIDVTVAATTTGEQWPLDAVPTFQLPILESPLIPPSFYFSPALAQWIDREIVKFDLVHIHTIFNFPAMVTCRTARRRAVPYIIRPCGILDSWSMSRSRLKKFFWLRYIDRPNLQGAGAIHFTSEEERIGAIGVTAGIPSAVIPLGIDLPEFSPKKSPVAEKIILFLSRLHPKKGLERLIQALGQLVLERSDFLLVVAGSGEPDYERRLRQMAVDAGIAERIEWRGFVAGPAKVALLRSADIFVLSSFQENFGIAVAEAMAYGVPVVISDRVNLHSVVAASGAGIVTQLDVKSLASGIRQLLQDDSFRLECGVNAANTASRYFSWVSIAQELTTLYQHVCRSKH